MNILKYLDQEWVPALGCTEPASIAYAGINAATQIDGKPISVKLTVDPRIYKNCYAVGIPNSGHKTGIKWATAIAPFLKDLDAKLECFRGIDENILKDAEELINSGEIEINIDRDKGSLHIDYSVSDGKDTARCLIEGIHTNVTLVEKNGKVTRENKTAGVDQTQNKARLWAASLETADILKLVKNLTDEERKKIREGSEVNLKIAKHGLTLFPKQFIKMTEAGPLTKISVHVCAGVYARMCGEGFAVMSVAGSGNKGITTTVPILMLEKEWKLDPKRVEEALALAMIYTSKTTERLGTLSAVCGCSNAAGIGLACAIVYLKGGGEKEISLAINNMVGNVTGMICDGAKIGCALKTMTAVDAAFRSATLAVSGIGIPVEDGIVGASGSASLKNMGRVACDGMIHTDSEILKIMEKKL